MWDTHTHTHTVRERDSKISWIVKVRQTRRMRERELDNL
jgi:hypothetical protein